MKRFFSFLLILVSLTGIAKAANDTCVKAIINPIDTNFIKKINVCPNAEVTLNGRAVFMKPNGTPANAVFSWIFGDGSVSNSDSIVKHIYTNTGIYIAKLQVTDLTNNCTSTNNAFIQVRVSALPNFANTRPENDTMCAASEKKLYGFINSVPWYGFKNKQMDTVLISDANAITSSINFNVFKNADILKNKIHIKIFSYLEHSKVKDLEIKVICPNGNTSTLKEYNAGNFPSQFASLGEPVFTEGNNAKGKGYYYSWKDPAKELQMTKTAASKHSYTDNLGGVNENVSYLPSSNYLPYANQNISQLIGCPLNGEWKLQITDKVTKNNGYLFGWGIEFDTTYYPDSLYLKPLQYSYLWKSDNWPEEANDTINFKPLAKDTGLFVFKFSGKNTNNCTYDTTIQVFVNSLPIGEVTTIDDSVFCDGDSIMLVSTQNPRWKYQWQNESININGENKYFYYAKITKKFEVEVLDTIKKCSNRFSKSVESKNCEIVIGNVFTPNGDGINDVFKIKIGNNKPKENNSQARSSEEADEFILFHEKYPNSRMTIYNRNGKKVYDNSNYQSDWDGGNNSDGVYFYILQVNGGKALTGIVNIIGKE